MRLNLQKKLMLLLLTVIAITLSSAVLVRNLLISDFRALEEGRMLDRIYQAQAVLEGRYQQSMKWLPEKLADDLVWARLSGFEIRLFDMESRLVLDTGQALAMAPDIMQKRVLASLSSQNLNPDHGVVQIYPLFLEGREIGHLEVLFPKMPREDFFIYSSNKFLTYSVISLGLTALLVSVFMTRRLTHPLKELTAVAEGIAAGNFARRVALNSGDEIGRLATTFNQMAETLEQQERVRKQLLSNAAHELRTPLMVMRGELEGMLDGLLPTSREALQSLHDETNRLTGILDGVDELTRAQAAFLSINCRETALVPFFEEILSRFECQATNQKVQMTVEGDRATTASLDRDLFTRIVINLASNALRAMPDGGQLDIMVSKTTSCKVYIDVKDTGTGIAPEDLPHIFERFFKKSEKGLGLGLAIVRELVEAHKGTISVSGEPGKGAWFLIELPNVKEMTR